MKRNEIQCMLKKSLQKSTSFVILVRDLKTVIEKLKKRQFEIKIHSKHLRFLTP